MPFLLLLSVGAFVIAVFLVRKRWRFTDTPTSDAAHVFPGLSEVHGVVEAIGTPANAASDGADCVWWTYEVERKQTDSKGNSHWVTEERGVTALPFLIRDDSGTVKVVLDDSSGVAGADTRDIEHLTLNFLRPFARVMKDTYNTEHGGILESLGKVFGSNEADEPISAFKGSWRATEKRLRVGDTVFISAHARLTPNGSAVEFARTDAQGKSCVFELSVGDEAAAISTFASPFAIGLLALLSLVLAGFGGNAIADKSSAVWFPVGLMAAAAVLYAFGLFNRVRRSRERCHFAWSLIDVASEQRAQTIPQLQAVVGAAFEHEQSALVAVAAARNLGRVPSTQGAHTLANATTATAQLVARIEALPQVRTQPNVAQLMQQLTLLTDRVAFGRRFYNDSVQRLADRVGQFPDSLFAKLGGVRPLPLIDDLDPPQLPPPVQL